MGGSDSEDYHFFGTPIEDDYEVRAGTYRKESGKDAATTRQLPVWKQEVTDAQGRRRFHGAFTGGFSAGYFNTAGSAEGWTPSTFRSSRSDPKNSGAPAAPAQTVEQFLDEDELEELRQTNLQTTSTYDTFGSTAAEVARRAVAEEARQRPSAIPGLLPEEAIAPVAEGIGIQLLQRMGWRQGKGVGAAARREERNSSRGWGEVAGVGPENTPLHLVQPKHDVHGIGYDPFKGAEEFRKAAQQHQQQKSGHGGGGSGADLKNKRRRGVAFGSGVLDEDDTFGMVEDYVTHDDVGSYEEAAGMDQEGLPLRRGPIVDKKILGDRLALQGFAYEVQDEEVSGDDDDDDLHSSLKKQKIYQLTGSAAPLLLKNSATELHEERQKGLIPGFVLASKGGGLHKPTYYPPPNIPKDYIPVYRPAAVLETTTTPAPPLVAVPAPEDEVLRQAIERLAFFVARNGPPFEVLARELQQQRALAASTTTNPAYTFLLGGQGAVYYLYKRASLQALLAPRGRGKGGKDTKPLFAPIGQRSVPLTAEDRGAMLGEQPLPASRVAEAAAQQHHQQPLSAAAVPLARSILNLAAEDRKRLAAAMGSTFVRAETEGDKPVTGGSEQQAAGLRPGAAPTSTTVAAVGVPDSGTHPQKPRGVVTREDLIQSTGRVSSALQTQTKHVQEQPSSLPVRRSEEWRPEPLLCKRLDVPDPYRGRPKEIQMSRFRTDHVALPATVEALGKAAAAAAPSGADFLLPPSVRVAAEEAAVAQLVRERATLPPPSFPPPLSDLPPEQQQQQEEEHVADAGEAAEAFLSSLFGQGPDVEERQKAEEEVLRDVAVLDKPVDLFKAIFEDSDEEDEDEEENDGNKNEEEEKAASLQQQQLPSATTKDKNNTEFGFEKLRAAAGGGGGGDAGRGNEKKDTTAPSGLESLDPEMRTRVEAALKVLKESKKKHKSKKKRKKERKSSKRKKERKKKKRSNASSSSGDNSLSSGESDD